MIFDTLVIYQTVLIMQDAHFSVEDILYGRRMALQPLSAEEQQLVHTAQRHQLSIRSEPDSDNNNTTAVSADQVCLMGVCSYTQ